MRNKVIMLSLSCTLFLLMGACAYTPTIFDPSIPLEESSTVSFFGIEVSEYNGISIPPKKEYSDYNDSPWVYVALPPGEAKFVADVNYNIPGNAYSGRRSWFGKGQKFSCNFEAGFYYIIYFAVIDEVWGVEVYKFDTAPKVMVGLPKDKLVAFIPFDIEKKQVILE